MISAPKRLSITLELYEEHRAAGEKWCWFHGRWEPREAFSVDRHRSDRLCAVCKVAHAEIYTLKRLGAPRRIERWNPPSR